jgi:GNAT superfamily N-acetyltransferase
MDIDVRQVEPADHDALDARHAVAAAALTHDVPDFPPLCPVRYAGYLRHPGRTNARLAWVAYLAGAPAGALDLDLPLLDNIGTAWMTLQVAPAYRRRGVGRALLATAEQAARERGRVRLAADVVSAVPGGAARDPAGPAFARAAGATEVHVEVRRRLDLSTVDLDAAAAAEAPGYSIVHWRDAAPDGYLADLARLERTLVIDAPFGDMPMDPPAADPERIRDGDAAHLASGERLYHVAMRHDATGALVAWTALAFEATVPDHAWQFVTVVDPAHRGRRLGLTVKLANLRHALGREPALRVIDTWNAATNRHMIAINEAMGFRTVDAWGKWQHNVAGA